MTDRSVDRTEAAGHAAPLAALAQIVRATAAFTGQRFFEALVTSLSRVLGVRYAFVGAIDPGEGQARTLACCTAGTLGNNFVYGLRGTPCEQVLGRGEVVHYERDVTCRFPEDRLLVDMGVQAYLGAPVIDGAGRKLGLVVVMHDRPIDTSLEPAAMLTIFAERASAELERAALEAKFAHAQKMEAVGRLAGGIAHDFNNLLTVMLSHAELALEGLPPGTDLHDSLDTIRESARRASGLTRQLLAFSRRQLVQPAVVDAAALVHGLRPLLARLLGENVTVSVAAPPGTWPVRVDPGQLDQVLMNLAVNARDAMPDGGRLDLSLRNLPAPRGDPLLGPLPPGDYLHLTVRDSGTGMDAATLRRVFEPFFTTKGERGTGLGLATCASVVEQAGGRVFAESEPGAGTTFHILLPRDGGTPEAGAGAGAGAQRPEGAPVHATVLLVEDDEAVRGTAVRALERAGHRVLAAPGARDALRLSAAHPGRIDLLFSDVVLPDGSGPDVGERLRATRPDLRALYVSGHTDDPTLRRAVEEGRVTLRAKPYTPDTLARWVAEALHAPPAWAHGSSRPGRGQPAPPER